MICIRPGSSRSREIAARLQGRSGFGLLRRLIPHGRSLACDCTLPSTDGISRLHAPANLDASRRLGGKSPDWIAS